MTVRRILTATLIGCVALSLGCRHRCCKPRRDECTVPAPVIGSPAPARGGLLPPQSITPPPSNYSPPVITERQPEVLLPSTSSSVPRSSNIIVYPPTGVDPIQQAPESAKAMPKASNAPSAELFPAPPPASIGSALPTGIADFVRVKDNVYSGLKPSLEGLTWLKKNNYKTVLRLRKPTDTDEADQPLVEQQGLKFVSLVVSPETMDRNLVEQFNAVVGDPSSRPILVYDKDGSLAGSMWYLHFRTAELLKDDEAVLRARKHGLREATTDEQRALWLAAQKVVSSKE